MKWDFSPKFVPPVRYCRRGHEKQPEHERCHICDREREVAAWQKLKDNETALAAHNAAQAVRKARRKKERGA